MSFGYHQLSGPSPCASCRLPGWERDPPSHSSWFSWHPPFCLSGCNRHTKSRARLWLWISLVKSLKCQEGRSLLGKSQTCRTISERTHSIRKVRASTKQSAPDIHGTLRTDLPFQELVQSNVGSVPTLVNSLCVPSTGTTWLRKPYGLLC